MLSLKNLSNIFPSNRGAKDANIIINEMMTDSRKKGIKGLFIPLVGEHFDGHDFLKDAITNGAIASLWKKDKPVPQFIPNDFPLFFVEDTTEGLQALAQYYLEKIKPITIGITGSNGKTTTKDLVYSVSQKKYRTFKTQGNFNNHIGLPLTILAMPENTEVLILEMGMNHFGEISFLSRLSKPHYAIITNIGESHIEYLGSREGIAKAKLEIMEGLRPGGKLIVDGDEPLLKSNLKTRDEVIQCGFEDHNDLVITNVKTESDGLHFYLNDHKYELSLLGKHNAKNSSYAIAVGLELGLTYEQIKEGLSAVEMTKMRLQRQIGKRNTLIINDAYNASPTSMKAAIETIKLMPEFNRKVLVLGDMYELGPEEQAMHHTVADVINEPITDLITIGEKGRWIADALRKRATTVSVYSFLRKDEAIPFLFDLLSPATVILIKASRGAKLESLVKELS